MRKLLLGLAISSVCLFSNAETTYTGDKIDGIDVISKLSVADLKPGNYRFMFKGTEMATGQHWYIPVMVTKGAEDGKKVLVQAGVHGDEINGVRIVQDTFKNLDYQKMKGSVIGVIGPNRAGIERVSRYWTMNRDGGGIDYNRVQPGKETGDSAQRQAWLVWNHLYDGNIDIALDFHTQSTGTAYPLFIYADYRANEVQTLAELFPADQIKKDPGEPGSVETTFIEKKIPAITVEVGSPRIFEQDMYERGLAGTMNVLSHYKVIDYPIKNTAKTHNAYIGTKMISIKAEHGGFAEINVKIGQDVKIGDVVAVQRNSFGDIIKEYKAENEGKVLAIATDVTREPGMLLVRILENNQNDKCKDGC